MAETISSGDGSFDLEERMARFGEAVIKFARTVARDEITRPILSQLIRSSTSVGANYLESEDAESKKDFRHKIAICCKESKETRHWLRMLVAADPNTKEQARILWKEAKELNLIFGSILRKQND